MNDKKQMRSAARLYAVQALFQMEVSGQTTEAVTREFEDLRFGASYDDIGEFAEGDDLGEHRPGLNAARERGVVHPFVTAGIGKDDIRALSREAGLPTWNKPSGACATWFSRPTHTSFRFFTPAIDGDRKYLGSYRRGDPQNTSRPHDVVPNT